MRVSINNFGGIIPRTSPHNLGAINASVAHNVKIRNGRLEPWRELCVMAEVPPTDVTFHMYGCYPVSWDKIVYVAETASDWGCFYITGRTNEPEVVTIDCKGQPIYTKLGVPTPVSPPRVSGAGGGCNRSSDARAYVYTYVNSRGEESAPSPASNIITVSDGSAVTVHTIALPPNGYDIRSANIYRAATGARAIDGKSQKPLTDYFYVSTVAFPTTSFNDTVTMANLSAAVETYKVRMPPAGLTNLTSIDGVVRLAGTVRNRVHMSDEFRPYSWPVKHDLTLDSTIVHMGCLDQKLYVTTDTTPYIIDVPSGDARKLDVALPDIACKYSSAVVTTQHGFIYCSPLGLVLIDPTGKYHILTAKWFSEDDWAQVQPDTTRLAYWEGFLFCITDQVSFILNIDGESYSDMRGAELSTISDVPVDLRKDSVGKLLMMQNGKISVWNAAAQYREFEWVSRELTGGDHQPGSTPLGSAWSPVSAKIRTADVEFTLITPLQAEAFKRKVTSEVPFRLPRVGRHMWFKAKLRGRTPVEFLDIGTAHFTVNQGA